MPLDTSTDIVRDQPAIFDLHALVRCPRCAGSLDRGFACARCGPYPVVKGQPALVDFDDSVLDRNRFEADQGAPPVKRGRDRVLGAIGRVTNGVNRTAERFARQVVERAPGGFVLVIGGGSVGSGAEPLYNGGLTVVGTDIYPTANTRLVADGHKLPFQDAVFDAVWIQAVLEHVLEPQTVADEIWRVLKPGGLVYADTPFMQQVHEGAYDFTRFTLSGHRWLFRRFAVIDAGVVSGAGTALVWSIRYFLRALTGSARVAMVLTWPVFWLRYFDGRSRHQADAASATYFFGARSDVAITPKEAVGFYAEVGGG